MKKNDIDDDMSKTFIAEVGQKSAIADDEEVLEKNTIESNFSDISIEPPKEEINTNEIGTNIEEKENPSSKKKTKTPAKKKSKKSSKNKKEALAENQENLENPQVLQNSETVLNSEKDQ